jgi:Carbohydrate-selective porin, OprB family/S-layer homology domain
MSKMFWKSLLVSPVILSGLIVSANVQAQEATDNSQIIDQINNYSEEGQTEALDQVTSVSQLRDVSPGDWAFEALRNLVERYGCISGYPDRTFRGDKPLTRYEFAAGLNSCMQQIERLIGSGGGDRGTGVNEADLSTVQKLTSEFKAELTALGARVDNLEARVGKVEKQQFSTTTKLSGEAILALTDTFGEVNSTGEDPTNTVFGDRVRLSLNTSFTGKDKLITRLAAGNLAAFSFNGDNVPATTQNVNMSPVGTGANNVIVDWIAYYLPVGKSQLYIGANGGIHSDYAATNNPFFEDYDGGNGALSAFASESPIYRIGGGVGAGFTYNFGKEGSLIGSNSGITLGYLAESPNNPGDDTGLFNGGYSALGQVNLNIKDRLGLGLTYVHGYNKSDSSLFDLGGGSGSTGVVGTSLANNPFGGNFDMVTNSYGAQASFKLSDKISLSGYGAYTNVIGLGSEEKSKDVWTYGLGVALPDFGKEGNLLGIFGGVQPYLSTDTYSQQNPIHVEAFYKYKLSDNISITPGVIWLNNPTGTQVPNQNGKLENQDVFIGTLRTTFTF